MKLLKLIIGSVLVAAVLSGCGKQSEYDKSTYVYLEDIKAVDVDMSGYEGFTDSSHVYKKITFKESLRFFDEKATGVVYYGYNTCPYCIQVVPTLNEVAEKYGLTVYYIDVYGDVIADADIERFLTLADEFLEHEDGEPVFYVPQVFVFVNGEITGGHLGAVDSYDPSVGYMSSKQKKELKSIFEDLLLPLK